MKDDRIYLEHILEALDRIQQYTADGRDAFMASSMIQDAVVRNLEIVGEATKRITKRLRDRHPDIPWKQAAGLRDVLSHDYMSIDLTIVWNVIDSHLAALRAAISSLLQK